MIIDDGKLVDGPSFRRPNSYGFDNRALTRIHPDTTAVPFGHLIAAAHINSISNCQMRFRYVLKIILPRTTRTWRMNEISMSHEIEASTSMIFARLPSSSYHTLCPTSREMIQNLKQAEDREERLCDQKERDRLNQRWRALRGMAGGGSLNGA